MKIKVVNCPVCNSFKHKNCHTSNIFLGVMWIFYTIILFASIINSINGIIELNAYNIDLSYSNSTYQSEIISSIPAGWFFVSFIIKPYFYIWIIGLLVLYDCIKYTLKIMKERI